MRTISMEECGQVAGGDGDSLSCPTGPFQPGVIVETVGPDGSFGGAVVDLLRSFTAFLNDLGGVPTVIKAQNADLGLRD